jgi:hypothetical protein
MNAHDRNLEGPAVLHYGDGEFVVLKPGRFVTCAVTGKAVPLQALRYWSAELQEPYAGPKEAFQRWRETHPKD